MRQASTVFLWPPASSLQPDLGSWSNRKTSVLQTEDSGATPDESTFNSIRSCSPAAKAASLQEEERWFESTQDQSSPGTPIG